jgi:hypothetical protein
LHSLFGFCPFALLSPPPPRLPRVRLPPIFARNRSSLSGHVQGGLEGLIGAPSPQSEAAVEEEHTRGADAHNRFFTPNYRINTTPLIEWSFVARPERPPPDEAGGAWPDEKTTLAPKLRRKPMSLHGRDGLVARLTALNERLEKERLTPIQLVEALAARMWTGPMYIKYEAVLRGSGAEFQMCQGNGYVTTLHCINSTVVKTSKLSTVTKVYRGVSSGQLPADFWAPNAYGACGAIEAAFVATTTDRAAAVEFAAAGGGGELEAGKPGVLLEIHQGMVNRGAAMGWCSQYEHEQECVPAACAGHLCQPRVAAPEACAEACTEAAAEAATRSRPRVCARLSSGRRRILVPMPLRPAYLPLTCT